jgi:DNA-binding CsgD family transcriptional regulator
MDQFSKARHADLSAMDRLSERQKQCLELVAAGYTSKQIARQLNLSPSTVDNHLNAALERLGVDSRALAARIFIQGNQNIVIDPAALDPIAAQLSDNNPSLGFGQGSSAKNDSVVASLFSIPPMGGRDNNLSQRRRYYHVVQIMILALMAFSAVTVTIAGIVHLFSQ